VLASLGMVVVALFFAMLEVPSLVQQKFKKDIIVFCLLLTISTTLIIFRILYVPMPNPMDSLMAIFSPFTNWVDQLLK
jgi:hypothetical protein